MQVSCEVMHLGSTWPRLVAQNKEVVLKCRRAAKTAPQHAVEDKVFQGTLEITETKKMKALARIWVCPGFT